MKLKVALLAVFALGVGSSIALAQAGKAHDGGKSGDCRHAAVQGNVAPFTLTLTVVHSHEGQGGVTTGQVVTVAVGSNGQIVHAVVEGGCSAGTGTTTTTFNARNVELRVVTPRTTTTTTTTTKKHDEQGDDDDQGEKDHHGTTTTTTAKTTTTTHS
jgi:hypothetical protein